MTSPSGGDSRYDDDLLPDRTSDEGDIGWGDDGSDEQSSDERLLADRPPHWDDHD